MQDYLFSVDFFTWNIPVWQKVLEHLKGKENLKFLEIGSFQGRSTVWLLENILTHHTSSITCIDTFEGSMEHHENDNFKTLLSSLYDTFMHNVSQFLDKVIVKKDKSQNALKALKDNIEYYDCIYIDGDHHAANVLEDAVLAFPLLKKDGILIFDDYKWGEHLVTTPARLNIPKPAIDAFLDVYGDKLKVIHQDYQVIIQKL